MIIRLTVRDNDFTSVIEKFANTLMQRLITVDESDDMSLDDKLDAYRRWDKIMKILSPNGASQLRATDFTFLKEVLVLKWNKFVDDFYANDEHIKKYLKDHFRVDCRFTFTDKWENGEVVYYFTTAQKWISQ